jgi:signal recognition particle receptor subunit beta
MARPVTNNEGKPVDAPTAEPDLPEPYQASQPPPLSPITGRLTSIAKIVIAGEFGVGKTTFISNMSETPPLTTDEKLSYSSEGMDDISHTPDKATTTVAMDFGRITLNPNLMLYLFGTPGQSRFWFMWDALAHGAIGAVVLADIRRLSTAFIPIDYFEHKQLPFLVAINQWDNTPLHPTEEIHHALALATDVPLLIGDARSRHSGKQILTTLIKHVIHRHQAGQPGRSRSSS